MDIFVIDPKTKQPQKKPLAHRGHGRSIYSLNYHPLDKEDRSIRLLELYPEAEDGLISTRLITTPLDSAPPYYALSYTWGKSASFEVSIRCNHALLQVTRTLKRALMHLRHLQKNQCGFDITSRYFWIDQICINQNDWTERSEQVQMMRDIYAKSIRTVIWHGATDDGISEAFPLIDHLYSIVQRDYPNATTSTSIPELKEMETAEEGDDLPAFNPDEIAWKQCLALFSMKWSGRIWVIQECAASSNEPIIVIGRSIYPWNKLYWAAALLVRRNLICRNGTTPRALQLTQHASSIVGIGDTRLALRTASLKSLLVWTYSKFAATNPRDLIYALVGMSSDVRDEKTWPTPLIPNYNKNEHEVFRDVAQYIMLKDQDISLLSLAPLINDRLLHGTKRRRLQQTSWVPWWNMHPQATSAYGSDRFPWNVKVTANSHDVELPQPSRLYWLCWPPLDDAIACVRFSERGALTMRGIRVGQVIYSSVPMQTPSDIGKAWRDMIDRIGSWDPEILVTAFARALYADLPERFCSTCVEDLCAFLNLYIDWTYDVDPMYTIPLITDKKSEVMTSCDSDKLVFDLQDADADSASDWDDEGSDIDELDVLESGLSMSERKRARKADWADRKNPIAHHHPYEQSIYARAHRSWVGTRAKDGDVHRFRTAPLQPFRNRQFFMCGCQGFDEVAGQRYAHNFTGTQVGITGYIGLGPVGLKIDDWIFALERGQLLYALRRNYAGESSGAYHYIGDCYIHDSMGPQAHLMHWTDWPMWANLDIM